MTKKRTSTFLVLVIGFLLPLVSASPVLPQDAPEPGDIVFFTENAANPFSLDLFAINVDGSNRHSLITSNEDFEVGISLAWSPDGEQIVFEARQPNGVGNTELWLMNADGTNMHVLTSQGESKKPAWSPDGATIAFESNRDGNIELYTIKPDGSDVRRLTDSAGNDLSPTWSPDSTQLVFETFRDGDKEIYVMNADGSNPRNISNHPSRDQFPAWSPDGNHITFASNRDDANHLYIVEADGENSRNLTETTELNVSHSTWSPDGTQIAFTARYDRNLDIYLIEPDGSNLRNLTQSIGENAGTSWSPDGTQIAFSSARGVYGDSGLYIMNTDGSGVWLISDDDGDRGPFWSPGAVGSVTFDSPSLVTPCPANYTDYLSPRLIIGETAQVIPGQTANRVRTLPTTDSEIIADIGSGVPFTVIGGPVCDPDTMILWWKIRMDDSEVGWTAEGTVTSGYFLEQMP